MSSLTLDSTTRAAIHATVQQDGWTVACLCAAWCGTCQSYRASFNDLAARHPDKQFVWIDIEDQADLVGDLDVENFPTLLLQHGPTVTFFGTVVPDLRVAERLLQTHASHSAAELAQQAAASAQARAWQQECDLRILLEQPD